MTIRVVIADDHPIVLGGLEQLLGSDGDFEAVRSCTDGRQALAATLELAPDLLVLDLRMPGLDGLEVLGELRRRGSETRAVLLTAAIDGAEVVEALSLGARGLLLKETAPQALLDCLRKVHAGGRWLEGEMLAALEAVEARGGGGPATGQRLSRREAEIVRLVGEGLRNREIGERLFISEGTVKVHLHNIFEKLGIDRRAALVRYASRRKLD